MADSIVIQSIQPDTMTVVVNLAGQTWQKALPFLTTQDAAKLTQQLQTMAQEMRDEFARLEATFQTNAPASAPVADAVNALIGQEIPVDQAAPAPEQASAI